MATPSVTLSARIETAPILKQIRELEKTQKLNFQFNERSALQPLGRIRTGIDQVNSSLDAANQRVLTFGASAFALGGTIKVFNEIVNSTVKVEKALLDINSVLNLSSKDLSSFKKELFDVARNASQSFDTAAKAALEFSRQGLGAEETVKRVNSALILSRLSGLDAATSVDSLTSAINGFSKEGLTASQVINRLVAVDTKFAVSTKDLAEALTRVGSTAQDSGVSFNKLLGIITSAQQITARGGAVIGNAFKTIFTRIQRPEVLDQLESFGIAVRDLSGEALSADRILENLGTRFDSLTKSQQQSVAELSAGIYQINQFRAIISDLARSYNVVEQATYAASSATVEAQKRNEALNKSLDSLLQNFKTTSTEIGDSIGKLTIAPLLQEILSGQKIVSTFLDSFRGAGKDPQIQNAGEAIAGGFLKGIGNVLSGPGVVAIGTLLTTVLKKTFSVVRDDVVGLFPGRNKELDAVRGLNVLLASASSQDKTRLSLVTGIAEKEKIILEILAKQNALRAAQNTQQSQQISSLGKASPSALNQLRTLGKTGVFAGGYSPIQQEMSAIKRGVGGASPSAKPVVIPNFNFGKGKMGSVVANTDEYLVPNYAFGGTAVFNKDMIGRMGLPSGARKVGMAGGFIPNYAQKTIKLYRGIAHSLDPADFNPYLVEGNPTFSKNKLNTNLLLGSSRENDLNKVDINNFRDFMLYLANSKSKTKPGVMPMSTSLEVAKGFTSADIKNVKKINFGDELTTQKDKWEYGLIKQNIRENRIYKDPIKLEKLFNKVGGFKGLIKKASNSGGIGVDHSLLFDYFEKRGDTGISENIDRFRWEKEVSLLGGLNKSAKLFDARFSKGYIPNYANAIGYHRTIGDFDSLDLSKIGQSKNGRVLGDALYFSQRKDDFGHIPAKYLIEAIIGDVYKANSNGIGLNLKAKKEFVRQFKDSFGPKAIRDKFGQNSYAREKYDNFKAGKFHSIGISANAGIKALLAGKYGGMVTPDQMIAFDQRKLFQLSKTQLASGYIPNYAKYVIKASEIPKKIMGGHDIQSIVYASSSLGRDSLVRSSQHSTQVKNSEKVGASPGAGYTSWTDRQIKNRIMTVRGIFEGSSEPEIRSLKWDKMKLIRANGNEYEIIPYVADGYIPNFANPLKSAISREIAAGVNPRDIYIDKDSRVKGPGNPAGLLVANKRDEPFGGKQGVNRALKEGMNPRKYGSFANGFIPNFAEFDELFAATPENIIGKLFKNKFGVSSRYGQTMDIGGGETSSRLRSLFRALRQEGTKSVEAFKQTTKEILDLSQSANLVGSSLEEIKQKISSAGTKLVANLTVAGATRAAELKQATEDEPRIAAEIAAKEARRRILSQQFRQATGELPKDVIPGLSPAEIARNKQISKIQNLTPQQIEAQKEAMFSAAEKGSFIPPTPAITQDQIIQGIQALAPLQASLVKINRGTIGGSQNPVQPASAFPLTPQQQANVNAVNAQQAALAQKKQNAIQLLDPTFREISLKKQLTGLSDIQLANMVGGGGTGNRFSDINNIRQGLTGRSYDPTTGFVNNKISGLVVALAKSGTLATDFNETVKNLILKGTSLEKAYEIASNDLIDAGGSNSQLSRAQLKYAYSLTDFEKSVNEQRASLQKQISSQKLAGRVSSVGISGLSRGEKGDLFSSLRAQAAQDLFAGTDPTVLANNKEAQREISLAAARKYRKLRKESDEAIADKIADDYSIERETGKKSFFSGFTNEVKKAEQYIAANPKLSRKAQAAIRNRAQGLDSFRQQRIANIGFGASVALPLLSGFVPEGRGGTGAGIAGGAAGGALSFAGTGALIGSATPLGPLGGMAIGAAVGGIVGAVGKLKVSFEELARQVEDNNAVYARQLESANNYVQLQQKINDAIASGASAEELKNLQKDQFRVLSRISNPETRKALLGAGSDVDKLLAASRPLSSQAYKTSLAGDVVTSLASARGEGFFSKNFNAETISNAANALASATDISNEEIKNAFEKFRKTFQDNPLSAFEDLAPKLGLSTNQIKETVKKLKDSPEDLRFIFELFVKNVDDFNSQIRKSGKENQQAFQVTASTIRKNLIREIETESALNQIGASSISKINKDIGLALINNISGINDQQRISKVSQINAREIQEQGKIRNNVIISSLKSALLEYSKLSPISGEKINNISSTQDIEKLIDTIGKGNSELSKLLSDSLLELRINSANTDAALAEQEIQTRIMSIESRIQEKNRVLSNSVFNEDTIQSFIQTAILGRTKGPSSAASQLSNIGIIDSLGLPETQKSILAKDILRASSAKDTYSEILSTIIGEQVKPDEASIRSAIDEITTGTSYDVFNKIVAERILKGIESINSNPQQDLVNLASGKTNIGNLYSGGKISFETGIIATKLDPLNDIKNNTADMAEFFNSIKGQQGTNAQTILQQQVGQVRSQAGKPNTQQLFGQLIEAEQKGVSLEKAKTERVLSLQRKIGQRSQEISSFNNAGLRFVLPEDIKFSNQMVMDAESARRKNLPTPTFFRGLGFRTPEVTQKESRALQEYNLLQKFKSSGVNAQEFISSLDGNKSTPIDGILLSLDQIKEILSRFNKLELTGDRKARFSQLTNELAALKAEISQIENPNLVLRGVGQNGYGVNALNFDTVQFIAGLPSGPRLPNSPLLRNGVNSTGLPQNQGLGAPVAAQVSGVEDYYTNQQNASIELQEKINEIKRNAINDSEAELKISKAKEEFFKRQLSIGRTNEESRLAILSIERKITQEQLQQARLQEKAGKSFQLTIRSRIQDDLASLNDLSDVANTVYDSLQSRAGDAFGDFVTGAKNAKDAFRDFTLGILNDTARAFASKAVQQFIGLGLNAIPGLGSPYEAGGPVQKYAGGGKVQALLTKGEYYISPKSANKIGRETLDSINNGTMKKYAGGGNVVGHTNFVVTGGSGLKDDVAATLQSGGYVIKKSAVEKYGEDYIKSLAQGKVEKRIIGGILIGAGLGAAIGGGIGYATGGKKGALIGAGIGAVAGGIGGYMYGSSGAGSSAGQAGVQTGGQTSASAYNDFSSFSNSPAFQNSSNFGGSFGSQSISVGSAGVGDIVSNPYSYIGGGVSSAGAAATQFSLKSALISLGIAGGIGLGAQALSSRSKSTSNASIPAGVKLRTASEMKEGEFAFLQETPQGGYTIAGYAGAPATRRYSMGGNVSNEISLASAFKRYAEGGEVSGESSPVSILNSQSSTQNVVSSPSVYIKIDINNNGEVSSKTENKDDKKSPFGDDFAQKLSRQVRDIVKDEMVQQSRVGGTNYQIKRTR